MAHIAIEAIKVKLDSNGTEVVYEPDTDVSSIAAGVLVEVAKIKDTDTGVESTIEAGTHTVVIPPPTIPHVGSSTVKTSADTDIVVLWSEAMKGTQDLDGAIDVIIDGAAPVNPASVSFSDLTMTLTLSTSVTAGQTITWAYDDQDPSERLDTVAGNVEADNQTYAVTNNVA